MIKTTFLANWKLRHIDLAGMAACVLGLVIIHVIGTRPMMRRQDDLAAQTAHVNAQRQNVTMLGNRASVLRGKLTAVRTTLRDYVPIQLQPASRINRRIAKLTDLAVRNGLSVDEIRPGETVRSAQHTMVPIHLRGSGAYPTWSAFLHQLTETFQDTSVDSFELSGHPGSPSKPATFQIDLVWHASAGPSRSE